MNGVELAARYAFPPNRHGYCGTPSFRKALAADLAGAGDTAVLKEELKLFRVHYAYLDLIARENGKDPFDLEVVRAFWIGNSLLERVRHESLREFIVDDLFEEKDRARAESLAEDLPEGALPHHSFNPLYVNFVSGRVRRSIRSFDSCCITFGTLSSVAGKTAKMDRSCVCWDRGFALRSRKDTVYLESHGVRLAGALKAGDAVSVHWGMVVQKLCPGDLSALERYTKLNMDRLNLKRGRYV